MRPAQPWKERNGRHDRRRLTYCVEGKQLAAEACINSMLEVLEKINLICGDRSGPVAAWMGKGLSSEGWDVRRLPGSTEMSVCRLWGCLQGCIPASELSEMHD